MALKNTEKQFGSLTKLCHWSIFILFVVQYFLVYRREYFPKDAPEKLQYILLHKSLGVVVLSIAIFMIIWRHVGTRPRLTPLMPAWEKMLAKITHFLLYISMLIMPITGVLMSQFSARPIKVFDWFTIPTMVEKNKELGQLFYTIHHYSSYVIIGLVALHIVAAYYHHFVHKDSVLVRMLPFKKVS